MKTILKGMLLFFLLNIQLLFAQTTNQANISAPPIDPITNCTLRYYYFPNLQAYFDTRKNVYYYRENGEWIIADEIPDTFRGYSVYNKLNVIITDYDDDDVFLLIDIHKKKYPYSSKGRIKQATVSSE